MIYVNVEFACCKQYSFDSEGRFSANTNMLGECLLFPSKDNKDWYTFKVPKIDYELKPLNLNQLKINFLRLGKNIVKLILKEKKKLGMI